jgi:signal transduction histidine kinase
MLDKTRISIDAFAADAEALKPSKTMISQTTTGPCLLIVDDDDSVREGFRWILQDQYRIIEAPGVDEALSIIDRERPDLVTLDIRMPEKNGLEGLRLIRERNEDLPIVMITGFGSIDTACEALRSGASDYLEKPCGYDQLRRTVREHLEKPKHFHSPDSSTANVTGGRECQLDRDPNSLLGKASMAFAHDLTNPLQVLDILARSSIELLPSGDELLPGSVEVLRDKVKRIEILASWCSNLAHQWTSLAGAHASSEFGDGPHRAEEIVEQALDLTRPYAEFRSVVLVKGHLASSAMLKGDLVQILRALVNLITNAIQASSTQGREVRVSLNCDSSSVKFSVTDNGSGIPPARLADFMRNDPFDRTNRGAHGLGLFIADWILKNHGGKLQLFSQEGVGTTAELILPLTS